jgi:peptidyl-prolyl cis-trans isomerase C
VLAVTGVALIIACEKEAPAAARVNGEAIYESEIRRELARVEQQVVSSGGTLDAAQRNEIRKDILDRTVEITLLHQASAERNIEVPEEEVQAEMDGIRARFPSADDFQEALKGISMTEEELEKQIRRDMTVQKLVLAIVEERAPTTDSDVRAYYQDNPDLFREPEQVKASHILILLEQGADDAERKEALSRIQAAQRKLRDGADFGETAKEFSEGPSGPNGGDLGFFARGQMVPPFEEAAFAMTVGQVSDVVETQFGLHLINVTDKRPAQTIAFEEVEANIRDRLRGEQAQVVMGEYVEELRSAAEIEILEPKVEK